MSLDDELPEHVRDALLRVAGGACATHIVARTDVDRDGNYGEGWLVATDTYAYVLVPDHGKAQLLAKVPMERISEARAEILVGGGVLEVIVSGRPVRLLHYSNSLAPRFARVARRLDALAKHEPLPDFDDEDTRTCDRCGRLLQEGTSVCPACLNKGKVLRRLIGYTRPYLWRVLMVVTLMVAGTALQLAPPWLQKILVDDVLNTGDHVSLAAKARLLGIVVLGLLLIHLVSAGIGIYRGKLASWVAGNLTLDIRRELYSALQRLSLSYFDKQHTGAVMSRVTQDANALHGFVVAGLPSFLVSILQLAGICTVLLIANWRLAVLVMLPAPVVAGLSILIGKRMFRIFRKHWQNWARLGALLNDALSGIRVIRAFAQEDRELQRFHDKSHLVFDSTFRVESFVAIFWPIMAFVTLSGTFLVWYFGGLQVLDGSLSLGLLLAFIGYLAMFYAPLHMLTQLADPLSRCLTATERIFEVLDTEPDVADAPDAVTISQIEGAVEFRNVTFGYEKHKPVLHNVTVSVAPGEMIGLVGHSGAGKSTIINLICRFYDATEGHILIDGYDVRKIRMKDLRRQIGVVLQEPFLFSGTVAENISYGKPGATREEIIRASRAANAHDFIMRLPDGYDSQVGERGGRLSGGERQRISIARAILHDPRILILDEATSSVDPETEKQIQQALARLVRNRTTFAIAHRLSTLRNANRLMVLSEGRLLEMGTHDELLARRGHYARLVELHSELSQLSAVGG